MTGLFWLHDPRLKPLALSQSPAWVWSCDAKRVLWANPTAAGLFSAPTPAALATRLFDDSAIAAVEVARLAATLRKDGGARLERLRGFGAAFGGRLTCACSRIGLADGTAAVLIAATERTGNNLSLEQRVTGLLAACTEPVAVFADDGTLLGATPSARRRLAGNATLSALGAETLTAMAQTGASAAGVGAMGPISITRLHEPAAWVVTLSEPDKRQRTSSATTGRAVPEPSETLSQASAPRLSAVEQRAFQELSLQLARRIHEAEALAARAANTNAPIEPRPAYSDRHEQPEATTSGVSSERPFLDELPVGVLVYRDRQMLYANPAFLNWTGCADLDALMESGGLHRLAIESGGSLAEQRYRQSFLIASAHNEGSFADARLLRVPWDGEWVTALLIMPPGDRATPQASATNLDIITKFSHETRPSLTAITKLADTLIQERFGPPNEARHRRYLKDIHASAEYVLSLIDDLLDLSKIEAGKLDLTVASVALNDLVRQCVAITQPLANHERVIVRTALSPRLAPAMSDPHALRRIVRNLLSTSIKSALPGGQVIVSTVLDDSGDVLLRVDVVGDGIGAIEMTGAVAPPSQITTGTGLRSDKIGLGLLLTKALAEASHATLQIKRAPNEGRRVEIAFPSARLLAAQ